MRLDWSEIDRLYEEGLGLGRQGVIGLLVCRDDGRVFAQRRSLTRRMFPGCWDLVGGHIEPPESPRQALERELVEETGWKVGELLGLRQVVDWQVEVGGQIQLRREFVLAITVSGTLDAPQLETTKVSEGRWFGLDQLEALKENREGLDSYVYDCVRCELTGTWSDFRYRAN